VRKKLAPVEQEIRKRLGNFILAEDDQTLEGVVLAELTKRQATLAIVEMFTSGQVAARFAHLPGAEKVFRRGSFPATSARSAPPSALAPAGEITRETAEAVARTARHHTGATHALAVLIDLDEGADRIEFGGTICLAIATVDDTASRRSRIVGGREWVRLGAVEMALDCLRRFFTVPACGSEPTSRKSTEVPGESESGQRLRADPQGRGHSVGELLSHQPGEQRARRRGRAHPHDGRGALRGRGGRRFLARDQWQADRARARSWPG